MIAFTATSPASTDFDYCHQIRNSSSSGPRNLVEGFGRFYPGEFARFTRNAPGSLRETQDHLSAGLERGYLSATDHSELSILADRAIGASVRLVKYLDSCRTRRPRN